MSNVIDKALQMFKSSKFIELEEFSSLKLSEDRLDKEDTLELLKMRGIALIQFMDYEEALKCFDQALAIAPNDPIVQMNLVTCYLEMKSPEKACLLLEGMLYNIPNQFLNLIMQNIDQALRNGDIEYSMLGDFSASVLERYLNDIIE